MNCKNFSSRLALAGAFMALSCLPALAWTPKKAPISTKWATLVNPRNPLPEYPRPQLARPEWQSLNGIWEYQPGNQGDATPVGQKLTSEICVPFPVESALSGVMEHHDRLWYRRSFTVPPKWKGKQLMLHFGAVDYEAQVFVNGQSVATHTGGYVPFSINVTPYLKGTGPQELIVRVFDPTEAGGQPRGKQTTKPGGIMYTPTTGIWQTVWIEPVAATAIQSVHMVPDVDAKTIRITPTVSGAGAQTMVSVKILDGTKAVKTVSIKPNVETAVPVANPKLWSPSNPFLYNVSLNVMNGKTTTDTVSSYFGMRKISVGMSGGVPKLLLNNNFVFQMGPLDQGFWPEGLYTAPTDEALRYDIEMEKRFGFNMVRKHIKVEPARWYYWADKLGILVWQDMPSPNSYIGNPPPIDKPAFEKEVRDVIPTLWNSPAIIMWVIFNEGQARHDTAKLVGLAKSLDPSRLTNRDSGAGYERDDEGGTVSDVDDVHSYPPPAVSGPSPNQALVCGEYGGIGFILPEHSLKPKDNWGYTEVKTPKDLEELYGEFTNILKRLQTNNGLSAAVYTEITDVEIESNGLMTYDRVIKCDPSEIALANRFQYPSPSYVEIIPTSETTPQTWKYTFDNPGDNWTRADYSDAAWQTGTGGFGGGNPPGNPRIGVSWTTSDIWLRRTFNLGNLTPEQVSQMVVKDYHDEDIDVYINGVLAYHADGFTGNFEYKPLTAEGKAALKPNAVNTMAVHVKQTGGGQYVDVGLTQRIPAKR